MEGLCSIPIVSKWAGSLRNVISKCELFDVCRELVKLFIGEIAGADAPRSLG